jgi:hypothetical protein
LIVQGLSEGLGGAQVVEHSLVLAERQERIAQVEAEIDGLLLRGLLRREMLQGDQCLLGHCQLNWCAIKPLPRLGCVVRLWSSDIPFGVIKWLRNELSVPLDPHVLQM